MNKMMMRWWRYSTLAQRKELARSAKISTTMLYYIAKGVRQPSAEMAGRIERAVIRINKKNTKGDKKNRLPYITRGHLNVSCSRCPYYRNALSTVEQDACIKPCGDE